MQLCQPIMHLSVKLKYAGPCPHIWAQTGRISIHVLRFSIDCIYPLIKTQIPGTAPGNGISCPTPPRFRTLRSNVPCERLVHEAAFQAESIATRLRTLRSNVPCERLVHEAAFQAESIATLVTYSLVSLNCFPAALS